MDCAICRLPMKRYIDRGVEIDACANDHTFFEVHELGQLDVRGRELEERLYESILDREPLANGRRCPRCQAPMIHVPHHTRKAEVCSDCGGVVLWNKGPVTDSERAVLALTDLSEVPSPSRPPAAAFAAGGSFMGLENATRMLAEGTGSASEGVGLVAESGGAFDVAVGGGAELAMHAVDGVFSFLGALLD